MDPLQVDTNQMTVDAESFARISTVTADISSYLRNALGLLGEFWGNDKVGSEFLAQWDPAVRGLLDTFAGLGDGMRFTAVGIVNSADLYKKSNIINSGLAR